MRCCLLIPFYNHGPALAQLLPKLQAVGLPTLIVDDGSSQAHSAQLRQLMEGQAWLRLISCDANGGKGAALKSGLAALLASGYSHALQIDADGQHNPNDIAALLALAEQHPDAVISGRPLYKNVPAARYYGRYITHFWVWIHTLSLDIEDSMCGFRVYPLAETLAVVAEHSLGDRMEFDTEILVHLHWRGIAVIQLPTAVDYPLDGVSHFRSWRDNALISWAHTRLFFGMLRRLPQLIARKWRRASVTER